MERIHQNLMISANSFVQKAAIPALRECGTELEFMKQTYNERRIFMLKRLADIGFKIHAEPSGAFYVFADARMFCNDSYDFAFEILENTGVGVTPGVDFGSAGEGFLRFSYANSMENIRTGLGLIEEYLKRR